MLSIFLFHAGLLPNGTFAVTFFFILSGFVIYYKYSVKINHEIGFKDSLVWGIGKIKKLYPIHVVTFLISIIIKWGWIIKHSLGEVILMGILNLMLLQSLVPKYAMTFNAASWYLSTLLICYLVAPLLVKQLKGKSNNKKYLIGVWCFQLILVIILPYLIEDYNYVFYVSPYMRIMDFFLGMILAKIYKERSDIKVNYNLGEIFSLVLFMGVYALSFVLPTQFTRGIIYSPIFLIGIYFISYQKGILSKRLCHPVFQTIAKISFEFYMTHELVLIVFRKVFYNVQIHWLAKNIIIAIPSFIIACVLSVVLHKYVTQGYKMSKSKSYTV